VSNDPWSTVFSTELARIPEGRQHLLSLAVDAEEGDEGGVFDQLLGFIDDPKLHRIAERHRDDEVRHAGLFRDCLARLGLEKQPIPPDLRIIHQIANATGTSDWAIHSHEEAIHAYALLWATERRGVERFPRIAEAFEPVDPQTAEVYRRVTTDERGHVRYCQRIGRHLAPSDEYWEAATTLAEGLESAAFSKVVANNLRYCKDHGWL
jgi:rubrerythrin